VGPAGAVGVSAFAPALVEGLVTELPPVAPLFELAIVAAPEELGDAASYGTTVPAAVRSYTGPL
jgi:hypothetical protein